MERKYLITRMNGKICSFLMNDQKAVEIHCDPAEADHVLNSIYIGKIKNIAKNIGAAFVEIAPGVVCHLALDDMKRPVYTKKGASGLPQAGDELLVQISREGIKTKYPSVTTRLTLHGKYVLLTTGTDRNSVSSKVAGAEKERLLSVADSFRKVSEERQPDRDGTPSGSGRKTADGFSWLFRTNAGGAPEGLLLRDMKALSDRYEHLMACAQYRSCYTCLQKAPRAYLRRLSDLYDSEMQQILTDDGELHCEIETYLKEYQPEDLDKLSCYSDSLLPMKKLYSLEAQLEQALRERVWLNSGGYLVIQPTEALTVIDVNTGKFEGGKKREAAFLKINREAAAEIARQLRLRNLSGIIIVDFINLEEGASKKLLLSEFEAELRMDPIRTTLVDMTKLSLVEITRQKRERPLSEQI